MSWLFVRRAVLVLATLVVVLGGAALRVRAELERQLLAATDLLLDLPPDWLHGAPRQLSVNGARIELSSGRSDLALPALLDHLQHSCRARSGGLSERARKLSGSRGLFDGVLRAESAREGAIACLDLGQEELSASALSARFSRLSERLNLAELGSVLFVRAQALEHGTFFVVVRSVGDLPLVDMFPERGDAPGVDVEDVPRPDHSRRIFSAWQEQHEPAIFLYEVQRETDAAWLAYTEQLAQRGFVPLLDTAKDSQLEHAGMFGRGAMAMVVLAQRQGSNTLFTLLRANGDRPLRMPETFFATARDASR